MSDQVTFTIEPDEVDLFTQEVDEHLKVMEAGVLTLEQDASAPDPEMLNAVFRAAHTIKAIAATIEHRRMAELTHTLETLFDQMRNEQLQPTRLVITGLLAAVDALKELREEVITRQRSSVDVAAIVDLLTALAQQEDSPEQADAAVHALTAALADKPHAHQPDVTVGETVRISIERLDTLMNLVGELVTERTRLLQIQAGLRERYGSEGSRRQDGELGALVEMSTEFGRVVDQLQQEVMQARMLPISYLFDRFPRTVRDVARDADKQVDLVISGAATELDRSVIEVIGDPLIHLLRNAVDHGIESPAERQAHGKPPTGTVWLTAMHEAGHVVITIKDDGQGIDPARVRKAAVRRGLLTEEEAARLDDESAVALIFEPNCSTVEKVTDVSGRGVGLDVVRTNVRRLGGSVSAESEVGQGATFRLALPLTLAIVQAMLVALGDDVYAVPLTSVVESLYLTDADLGSVKGRPVIQWRESVLPLLYLRQFFAHPRLTAPVSGAKSAVVVVTWGKQRVGLIVDRLIGKQEIVIKSLGGFVGNVTGVSGCTILGDGRIALIVDIPGVIGATLRAQREEVSE